jgi:hypothetical protein
VDCLILGDRTDPGDVCLAHRSCDATREMAPQRG